MMAETGYGCVTALYDCRSKQEYIYRTNRIREISGGSELLANVYGMFFRAAGKKGLRINSDWRSGAEFSVRSFAESGFDGEVIYEGGGNLFIMYKSRETYIRANRIFSRMLLEKTYTISVIAACVETTDNFKEDRTRLYKENSRIKSTDWISVPCNTLPITQVDRDTFMPIVKKEDNCSLSRESVLKCKAFEKSAEVGEMFLDDISGEENKGTESLLAVIYVDGNAMSKKVKACTGGRPAPIVTKIFWVVLGPRASAVTRRLPTPSTSTGPSGGTSARSSSAACSMTSASRSSSTLTLGTSSVTYRPRGFSRPSRAISTRVTVTPPRRAVAVRTPPGRSAAAAYSSSAISVKRIVFPHFCSIFRQKAVFGALQHKKYGKIKTF